MGVNDAYQGEYEFIVTDSVAYPSSFSTKVSVAVMPNRPIIYTPPDQKIYAMPQDIEVIWADADTSEMARLEVIESYYDVVYTLDGAHSPLTVPASTFHAGRGYAISITDARYHASGSGLSVECAVSQAVIQF